MAVTGPRAFKASSKPGGRLDRRGGGGGVGALSCASPKVAARIAAPCTMSRFSSVDAVSADMVRTLSRFARASLARRNKPSGRPPFHRRRRAGANFEDNILSMAVNDASEASLNSFLCTIFRKIAASSEACARTASTRHVTPDEPRSLSDDHEDAIGAVRHQLEVRKRSEIALSHTS